MSPTGAKVAGTGMPERERASILAELMPPFTILSPHAQTVPFVLCSPHSGRIYPRAMIEATRLSAAALRKSEDCYVDELIAPIAGLGAPMIAARFPRAYLDVNREANELDPELFHGRMPPAANTQSMRVVGGLGVIARVVADQEEIYRERLPLGVAFERIERLYKPFHQALDQLLAATVRRFGCAVLIDCHSMPSASAGQPQSARPDMVVGDRFGTSCDPRLTRAMREAITALGYEATLNRPYAGGFITEHYGRPHHGVHAIQLEINRALYLNEATFERSAGFVRLSANLARLADRLFLEAPALLARRTAAE